MAIPRIHERECQWQRVRVQHVSAPIALAVQAREFPSDPALRISVNSIDCHQRTHKTYLLQMNVSQFEDKVKDPQGGRLVRLAQLWNHVTVYHYRLTYGRYFC